MSFADPHDLRHALPGHDDAIHALKESDAHFRRIFDEYHELCDQLHRVEQEIETPADHVVETMKKARLKLLDALKQMVEATEAA